MSNKITEKHEGNFIPAKQLLRNLILAMRVQGIYFPRESSAWRRRCYWVYMAILSTFSIFTVARQSRIVMLATNLTSSLVSIGVLLFVMGTTFISLTACYGISKHLSAFLDTLDKYRFHFGEISCIGNVTMMIRVTLILIYVLVPMAIVTLIYTINIPMVWESLSSQFWPFSVDTPLSIFLFVLYVCCDGMRTGGIMVSLSSLFLIVCYVLIKEFKVVETKIKNLPINSSRDKMPEIINVQEFPTDSINAAEKIIMTSYNPSELSDYHDNLMKPDKKNGDYLQKLSKQSEEELETLRNRFEGLLDILAGANDVLAQYMLSIYASSLPVICLLLYGSIKDSGNKPLLIFMGLLSFNSLAGLVSSLLAGSYLSIQVKKPLEYVMKINVRNASENLMSTISLLTARLNTPMGFSIFDFITLDTTTTITIFGTLLTYAIVIYQFAETTDTFCLFKNATNSL